MKKKPETNRGPGRPTIYSKAITDEICGRLASGEPLRGICKDKRLPARSTVYRWLKRSHQMAIIRAALEREGLIPADCED